MVEIKKIKRTELPQFVKLAYLGDIDLVEKYHPLVGATVGECINETVFMINEAAKGNKCKYYKVFYKKQPIGYFVIWERFLYSFGINIKHRTKDVLTGWWAAMKKIVGKNFLTMLYAENSRAIEFCERQGMVIHQQDGNLITLANFN